MKKLIIPVIAVAVIAGYTGFVAVQIKVLNGRIARLEEQVAKASRFAPQQIAAPIQERTHGFEDPIMQIMSSHPQPIVRPLIDTSLRSIRDIPDEQSKYRF